MKAWMIVLVLAPCLAAQALGGSVVLKSGETVSGIVVSRAESTTGEYVITVARPESRKVFQYPAPEVAEISSATEGIRILKAAAPLLSEPAEDAPIVQRFGPGMSLELGEKRNGWVKVTPEAAGLKDKAGWVRQEMLTRRLDFRESVAGDSPDPGEEPDASSGSPQTGPETAQDE